METGKPFALALVVSLAHGSFLTRRVQHDLIRSAASLTRRRREIASERARDSRFLHSARRFCTDPFLRPLPSFPTERRAVSQSVSQGRKERGRGTEGGHGEGAFLRAF